MCEEVVGNSDCGVPDTFMIEESFKTADMESCRSICASISSCTFFTFSGPVMIEYSEIDSDGRSLKIPSEFHEREIEAAIKNLEPD